LITLFHFGFLGVPGSEKRGTRNCKVAKVAYLDFADFVRKGKVNRRCQVRLKCHNSKVGG